MTKPYIDDSLCIELYSIMDGPPEPLGAFLDDRVAYMRRLRALHPVLREPMQIFRGSAETIVDVEPDLSNVRAWGLKHLWDKRDDAEQWYTALDAERRPTEASLARVGYRFRMGVVEDGRYEHASFAQQARPNNTYGSGSSELRLPLVPPPEFLQPGFIRQLIGLSVEHFRPATVRYGVSKVWLKALNQFDSARRTGAKVHFSWYTYLANPAIGAALPRDLGLEVEPLGPGILVRLQSEPPQADNDAAVARVEALYRALGPAGWLRLDAMVPGAVPTP